MEKIHASLDSPPRMDLQVRIGLLSGWLMLVFFTIGFIAGDYIPPLGPASEASETAAFYHHYIDLRRLAVICILIGGSMFIPFGAAIADRLRQIKGVRPMVVYTEMGAAIASGTLMMVFGSFLLLALLRPDMPDSSYQLLHDLTWLAWAGLWQPGALQAASVAVAVLSDRSSTPLFPRWLGWFSAWMAIGSLTGSMIPFFTVGPFAWNGAISFFLAGTIFFGWFVVMLYCMHKVARRELNGDLDRTTNTVLSNNGIAGAVDHE